MANLPPINRTVLFQGVSPKRWRVDVCHPTRDDNFVAFGMRVDRRTENVELTDGSLVYVGFVGEVHQVVDYQSVVTLDMVIGAIERPIWMRTRPEVGN